VSILFPQAYGMLIRFDRYLARRNFSALYDEVRNYPIRIEEPALDSVERICSSVDLACIWYWKEVLCLQRSAATTCLLRRYGVRGQMVIGTQQMPFKAHAWVEVQGRVVNDKPYTPEMYVVLDRC
jgi:Transglutaminase-like superfamily